MGLFQSIVDIATAPDKPELPAWTPIDPQAEQRRAIRGNTAALTDLERLADSVNTVIRSQTEKNLEAVLPGYAKLRDKGTQNILDWESGRLPQDVQDIIARTVAEGSRASGTGGSQFANFKEARTLGLTSLDLQRQGTEAASRWIEAASRRNSTYDFTQSFISPALQIQTATNERNAQFNYTWAKNQWDATPSPLDQALKGLYSSLAGIGDTALTAFGGSIGGWAGAGLSALGGGGGAGIGSFLGGLFNRPVVPGGGGGGGGGGVNTSSKDAGWGGLGGFI